jgi:hypothetical protein
MVQFCPTFKMSHDRGWREPCCSSAAKHLLETELDKEFSLKTLKRFLKKTTADTNVFD